MPLLRSFGILDDLGHSKIALFNFSDKTLKVPLSLAGKVIGPIWQMSSIDWNSKPEITAGTNDGSSVVAPAYSFSVIELK